MKEDLWAVIEWKYGRHADEFIVEEVTGPLTFEEADSIRIELEAECKLVKLTPIKGVKANDQKTSTAIYRCEDALDKLIKVMKESTY